MKTRGTDPLIPIFEEWSERYYSLPKQAVRSKERDLRPTRVIEYLGCAFIPAESELNQRTFFPQTGRCL